MFTTLPESSDLFESVSWHHFLALWRLTSALDKKQVTKSDVLNIQQTIRDYIESFLTFKDYINEKYNLKLRLTPKHLWVMSYPRIISHVGPISSLDTNIGEMKNYTLKLSSQKANQTKNTIKTMAIREAQKFCFNASSKLCKYLPVPSNPVVFDDLEEQLRYHCLTNDLSGDAFLFFTRTAFLGSVFRASNTCGIIYQKNFSNGFGVISTIAYQKHTNDVFFIVKKVRLSSVPNLCLKECHITCAYEIVNISQLICERPVYIYRPLFDDDTVKNVVCIWRE